MNGPGCRFFFLFWIGFGSPAGAAGSECPAVHDGKLLENSEVFDGPLDAGQALAPERNRWLINPIPQSLWSKYSAYYLICTYRGTDKVVSVELPRNTRLCRPTGTANIRCR